MKGPQESMLVLILFTLYDNDLQEEGVQLVGIQNSEIFLGVLESVDMGGKASQTNEGGKDVKR